MIKRSERAEKLIGAMTLEEKVALMAGASLWTTVPVERLGIPAIKVTDGPNGARGGGMFGAGKPAACFPSGIGLAATWDTELVGQVGEVLAEEAKTKGCRVLLAPTVNIHRSPLNGRNFECYSEDPFLTARMAVAYIKGLQSRGVSATVKHFICNDSEFERNSISSEVRERALREIYLPPFEAAIREAGSMCIMSSYNRINGVYACDNADLLTRILKEEWGFEGVVMSDWFGTQSTAAAANAGLDLEMPGPAVWRGERLLQAVRDGQVNETVIDEAATRLLTLIERLGAFEDAEIGEEQAVDRPEHRAIARKAAAESIVLLKNAGGLLPLDPESLKKVAIIGPNAKNAVIMGGGSAEVNPHYAITPYQGIIAQLGSGVEVSYELGCTNHKFTARLDPTHLTTQPGGAENGLRAVFFNDLELKGEPVYQTILTTSEQIWLGTVEPGVDPAAFSARISGFYTPAESGRVVFGISSSGRSRLYVNGRETIDNWTQQDKGESFMGMGSTEKCAELDVTAGMPIELVMEYSKTGAGAIAGIHLGSAPIVTAEAIRHAVELAQSADVALVCVGLNGEWETEGSDRPNLELIGSQAVLVEAVAAVNPNTVVILQTGSPVSMPWLEKASAVLEAWFPGQECGNAIADVIFGKVDASGRLPQTFPLRLEDNPAYLNYPGENGKVFYGEGIFVGYRYYDKKKIAPLFPFGFGLSYTSFAYANLKLSSATLAPGETLQVWVNVTNTGKRSGSEVVQFYVRDVESKVQRPEKELKAFARVALQPGETRTVSIQLGKEALAFYDDGKACWQAEAGDFQVLVGSSSRQIHAAAGFTLTDGVSYGGQPSPRARLTMDSSLRELLDDDCARAILEDHLPGFSANPQLEMVMSFSLVQLAGFAPEILTADVLQAIAYDIKKM